MCSKLVTSINGDIDSLLNSIAEKNEFNKYVLEVSDASLKGDGYTAIAKNYKLINSNDPSKALYLFVKRASRDKYMRQLLPLSNFFSTEIYMYNTVFPIFRQMEIQKGLSPSTFIPNCYGTLANEENEILILENLGENGFRLHDCRKPMDTLHMSLVIKAYAKLHSLSFALRDQKPEVFKSVQSKLMHLNSFPKIIVDFNLQLRNKYKLITNTLTDSNKETLEKFLQNLENEITELTDPSIDDYSVILHGDSWNNNVLFKYGDNGRDPTDIFVIDYQLSRPAPGILDFSHFFFSCSSLKEMQRCNEYLELYYNTLSTHLQSLGCDPNKLYPYYIFKQQWKIFAKFALIMSPLVLQVMLCKKEELFDLETLAKEGYTLSESFCCDMKGNVEYRTRICGIVTYLIDNNLL